MFLSSFSWGKHTSFSSFHIFWAKRRPRYNLREQRKTEGLGMSTFLLLLVSTLSTSSQASFPFDSLLFFSPFSLHCMIPLCSPSCLLIVYIIEPLFLFQLLHSQEQIHVTLGETKGLRCTSYLDSNIRGQRLPSRRQSTANQPQDFLKL